MYQQDLYRVLKNHVKPKVLKRMNRYNKWEYGYNEDHDMVVISKTGKVGEIYEIQNLKIALPEKPEIVENLGDNKWERKQLPLDFKKIKTIFDWEGYPPDFKEKWYDYIDKEFVYREEGFWFINQNNPTYITGTHYMYLQWSKIDVGKPDFREANRLFFIFWEASKADNRCYGMCYLKNRRSGFSFMSSAEAVNLATISTDSRYGILSKSGSDAKTMLQIRWFQFRSTIHSSLNRSKTVWTGQKPSSPIESLPPSLPVKNWKPMKKLKKSQALIQLSIGRTQVITPTTVRNSNSSSTMKAVNGKGQTTSLTTGGLQRQR